MSSSDLRRGAVVALLALACGGSSSSGPRTPTDGSTANVLPLTVGGACSAYINEPCVSATVCVPGTSSCQTVDHLLLDTGSSGLRVFSQVLNLKLPAVSAGGQPVAECISYADGTSQWGPVVQASVVLGGEAPVTVPIQVVDSTYGARPSTCQGAETGPSSAGYDGILGVATFLQDCGDACATAGNGVYFACTTSTCADAAVPLGSQVQNPVGALPRDGNGVVVKLPAVPGGGSSAGVAGQLVLGIGTRADNVPPASVIAFPLDSAGELRTTLDGVAMPGFLDTGSNGLFFPPPSGAALPACPSPNDGWYCPASTTTLSASNAGAAGSPSASVTFTIANFEALGGTVAVSSEVGGSAPASSGVDWGLPFHLGRDVYVGFEARSSPLGAGPVVGY